MYPGCEPFEYESVSGLDNSCTGSMGGRSDAAHHCSASLPANRTAFIPVCLYIGCCSFNFQLANSEELIEVTVAPFRLDLQHNFN